MGWVKGVGWVRVRGGRVWVCDGCVMGEGYEDVGWGGVSYKMGGVE